MATMRLRFLDDFALAVDSGVLEAGEEAADFGDATGLGDGMGGFDFGDAETVPSFLSFPVDDFLWK